MTIDADMIGMSAHGAEAKDLLPRLEKMSGAGFKAVEIPSNFCIEAPGFSPTFKRELKEALEPFSTVTVHGMTTHIDAHEQPPQPLDAQRLKVYFDLMDFAHDVGARIATFHPLMPHKYDIMLTHRFDDEATVDQHVEAGRILLPHGRDRRLTIGFEAFDTRIADRIDDEGWGSLFDIGHASQTGVRSPYADLTEQAHDMIRQRLDRIVQFHVHGVAMFDGSLCAHQPLDADNLLDYGRIVGLLNQRRFQGPLIFEIVRKGDRLLPFEEAVEACVAAKQRLAAA